MYDSTATRIQAGTNSYAKAFNAKAREEQTKSLPVEWTSQESGLAEVLHALDDNMLCRIFKMALPLTVNDLRHDDDGAAVGHYKRENADTPVEMKEGQRRAVPAKDPSIVSLDHRII